MVAEDAEAVVEEVTVELLEPELLPTVGGYDVVLVSLS